MRCSLQDSWRPLFHAAEAKRVPIHRNDEARLWNHFKEHQGKRVPADCEQKRGVGDADIFVEEQATDFLFECLGEGRGVHRSGFEDPQRHAIGGNDESVGDSLDFSRKYFPRKLQFEILSDKSHPTIPNDFLRPVCENLH